MESNGSRTTSIAGYLVALGAVVSLLFVIARQAPLEAPVQLPDTLSTATEEHRSFTPDTLSGFVTEMHDWPPTDPPPVVDEPRLMDSHREIYEDAVRRHDGEGLTPTVENFLLLLDAHYASVTGDEEYVAWREQQTTDPTDAVRIMGLSGVRAEFLQYAALAAIAERYAESEVDDYNDLWRVLVYPAWLDVVSWDYRTVVMFERIHTVSMAKRYDHE